MNTVSRSALRFDRLMALLGLLIATGLSLDGWAHNHIPKMESFFTPWHAVFYGAFGLLAGTMLATILARRRRGATWRAAVPPGYGWAAFGIVTFLLSALGDMLWHIVFGVESSVSVLFSPTHLGIASSLVLVLGGPFQAATGERLPARERAWPSLLSLSNAFTAITFVTQYATPLAPMGTGQPFVFMREASETLGALVILWSTALFMGLVLVGIQRWKWRLPFGALTFVFTLNALMMALQVDGFRLVLAVFLSGLVADALLAALRPTATRRGALCAFCFLVPVVYWILHDVTLGLLGLRFFYPVPLWTGTIVGSGLVGVLLTTLIPRPAGPPSPIT